MQHNFLSLNFLVPYNSKSTGVVLLTVEGDWSLVFQVIYGIYMVFIIEMIGKKRMRCSFNFIATQKERINLCLKLSINLCLQKWPKLNLVSNLMINDKQDKFQ